MAASYLDLLRRSAVTLQATYDHTRNRLIEQLDRDGLTGVHEPEDIRDANGRYILLDALTAVVLANTALATADREVNP